MVNRKHIIEAVRTHLRAESALDKAEWLALFSEKAVIEDPVGLATWCGITEIRSQFWANVERAQPKLELLEDVIVCGNEAIAVLSAEINRDDARVTVSPIVVNFQYDDKGKVARLRSFIDYG